MATNRKELFDIPKKLSLNEKLSDWCDVVCERRNISFSRYIRLLIEEHMRRTQKELSAQNQPDTSPKQGQNQAQTNGLYTAEQVAQLINAMKAEK